MSHKVTSQVCLTIFIFFVSLVFPKFANAANYYVATNGNNSSSGTLSTPWQTIAYALTKIKAGDTLYIRGGEYETQYGGWVFTNSGTASSPITITNYPSEQAVLKITQQDEHYVAFRCWGDDPSWRTPKSDYVHINATTVSPHTFSNGLESNKGIVIIGPDVRYDGAYTLSNAFWITNCNNWDVSGLDIINIGNAFFARKDVNNNLDTTGWDFHDNRIYGFYAESGIQLNSDNSTIENNEIYKVHSQGYSAFGCQHINILGYGNVIRNNLLSEEGSADDCFGILFEWDIADHNVVDGNLMVNMDQAGIKFAGGDNNLIMNNIFLHKASNYSAAINVDSIDSSVPINSGPHWHCNTDPGALLPPNNPSDPTYYYYYDPRNCHSYGNKIYNNIMIGYKKGIIFYELAPEDTSIVNNAISASGGAICVDTSSSSNCTSLPSILNISNNAFNNFGFVNQSGYDFHLASNSPLIDAGTSVASVDHDKEGISRPQGQAYDIGAYEYTSSNPPSPTPTPTPMPGDANNDGTVDGVDYVIWLNHYNQSTANGSIDGDFNTDHTVNGVDYVIWLNHYAN